MYSLLPKDQTIHNLPNGTAGLAFREKVFLCVCVKTVVLRQSAIFFPAYDYLRSTRKNSKYWDIYVWANSVDSDQTALKEQSYQDLLCLPFFLHLMEALLQCKIKVFYIKDNYSSWSGCPNI